MCVCVFARASEKHCNSVKSNRKAKSYNTTNKMKKKKKGVTKR